MKSILLLRDNKNFVPFCFESHTGYCFVPWYPPPAYATFVKLLEQLDVIDLKLLSNLVHMLDLLSRLSAAAHAGAASRDPVSESSLQV